MTSRIASSGGSPPRRTFVQPALPLISIKQSIGHAGSLTRATINESTKNASNGTDKSEDSSASDNAGLSTLTNAAIAKEPLIVDGSRHFSILPRSASMNNINSLRSAAGSRTSDRPKAFHRAVQSVTIEDPFLATPDRQPTVFSNTSITPPQLDRVYAIQAIKTPGQDLSPRQDRLGQEVTPANAQGVHTPAACVFMANLSSQRTLDQLQYSVAKAMEIYGKCYVKVQFDKNKMPYAFVQFEMEEEARVCITNARGLMIDGRPIRVEHAKAQRAVYLAKVTGGPVTDEEARNVLGRFGAIEETCQTTVADQEMHNLPEGCWVKFRYFMDCKDAVMEFRQNQFFKLFIQEKNEQGQRRPSVSPSPNRGSNRGFKRGADAKAIFVGGIPSTVTEEQLRKVFLSYGNILDCKIIRKSLGGDQVNIFAFVEFRTATEAQAAQNAELSVDGVSLRIEPKRYTMRRAARNNMNSSPITFTSRTYQDPVYHDNGSQNQYDNNFLPIYSNGTTGYTITQTPHVFPIRGAPTPHYGNTSNMSPYTSYPSPHYTSPLAPRGSGGFDMSSPSPMYHGGGDPPPSYYGSYMAGGPSVNMGMGPSGMQPIAQQDVEMGPGGF